MTNTPRNALTLTKLSREAKALKKQTPGMNLHQAQAVIAKQYKFSSWDEAVKTLAPEARHKDSSALAAAPAPALAAPVSPLEEDRSGDIYAFTLFGPRALDPSPETRQAIEGEIRSFARRLATIAEKIEKEEALGPDDEALASEFYDDGMIYDSDDEFAEWAEQYEGEAESLLDDFIVLWASNGKRIPGMDLVTLTVQREPVELWPDEWWTVRKLAYLPVLQMLGITW